LSAPSASCAARGTTSVSGTTPGGGKNADFSVSRSA
jgi:hypothetical protein